MSPTAAPDGREPSAPAAPRPRARLTHDEAVARARALAPTLKERAAEAEALRRLPDATCRDFAESGLFGILQPARWGGSELDLRTFLAVGTELARGCSASAWVYTVTESHFWILSLFPEPAQIDVWGARPDTLIATSVAPMAREARRVADGYQLSGRWSFSSGCDLAEWIIVGGLVPPEAPGPPAFKWFLLPKPDYTIDDDWYTAGMRGTGSKALVVEGAFVPEHRVVEVAALFAGRSPGRAVHAGPLYRVPLLAGWPTTFMGPALGTALAAYDTWRERARTRRTGPGGTQAEQAAAQLRLAESHAQIDCARLLIQRDLDEVMDTVAAGAELSPQVQARVSMDFCYVVKLCTEAVDRLFAASGGTALYDAHPMQRHWRDVHAIAAHHALDWDTAAEQFGRVELGLPPKPLF